MSVKVGKRRETRSSSLEIADPQVPSILACEAVVLRYLLLVQLILLHHSPSFIQIPTKEKLYISLTPLL